MNDATHLGSVTLSLENNIARIEFAHPMSNSLPGKILAQLADTIHRAGKMPEVHVIILQSAGDKAFCAGASFEELQAIDSLERGKVFFSGFANVINAMRTCSKFILARVQGKAVGGGVGLASAADLCFATESASIKLSELAVGIGPFVVGPAVERKMGLAAMSHLAMDASSWQTAQWAREKGLYAEVFDSITAMDVALENLSNRLAKSNPEAMGHLKEIFWHGTEHWDTLLSERAAISGKLVLSEFTKQAIASFKAK